MVVYQKKGDHRPIGPPTPQELQRHRWHATRRGTVSFAAAPEDSGGSWPIVLLLVGAVVALRIDWGK